MVATFSSTEICFWLNTVLKGCVSGDSVSVWSWDLPNYQNTVLLGTGDTRNSNAVFAHISLQGTLFDQTAVDAHYLVYGEPLINASHNSQ